MTPAPRSVTSLLHTADSELGAIARRAGYLATVRRVVLDALPADAAAHVHVAAVDSNRLLLHTESAGWATRLRYTEPAIQRALAQRLRLHADRVIIRVRPDLAPPARRRIKRHISAANREHMRQMADYIDNPELARVLLRLADRVTD